MTYEDEWQIAQRKPETQAAIAAFEQAWKRITEISLPETVKWQIWDHVIQAEHLLLSVTWPDREVEK